MKLGRLGSSVYKHWSAKDYVQDGLVAMWDGIENAGWGTHDASVTVWKDLVGSNDLTLYNPTYVDGVIHFTQNAYAQGSLEALQPNVTIEFCGKNIVTARDMAQGQAGDTYTAIRIKNSDVFGAYYIEFDSLNNVGIRADSSYSGRYNFAKSPTGGTFTLVGDGSNKIAYLNGELKGSRSRNVDYSFTPQYVIIGRQDANQWLTADYCNLRIYNRALTAAEIARNYRIDKYRFNLP